MENLFVSSRRWHDIWYCAHAYRLNFVLRRGWGHWYRRRYSHRYCH